MRVKKRKEKQTQDHFLPNKRENQLDDAAWIGYSDGAFKTSSASSGSFLRLCLAGGLVVSAVVPLVAGPFADRSGDPIGGFRSGDASSLSISSGVVALFPPAAPPVRNSGAAPENAGVGRSVVHEVSRVVAVVLFAPPRAAVSRSGLAARVFATSLLSAIGPRDVFSDVRC